MIFYGRLGSEVGGEEGELICTWYPFCVSLYLASTSRMVRGIPERCFFFRESGSDGTVADDRDRTVANVVLRYGIPPLLVSGHFRLESDRCSCLVDSLYM